MPQTAIEKIVQRHAVNLDAGEQLHAGDFVTIRPKHVMTHDNTGAVIPKFKSIGATKVKNPRQPVFAIDHDIQNTTPENLGKYAKIEAFAREHDIDYYPPGRGIAHQVMVEEGYVTPGALVVGSDSHSNLYGAVAAVGTPVVRTDAAALWATGQTWWQIPDQVKVILEGQLSPGASGKDVIITLCGHFNRDEVLNCALEFHAGGGGGVAQLTVDERMTIANMTTEWGALVAMFPFDETLRDYLYARADHFAKRKSRAPHNYSRDNVDRWWDERAKFSPDDEAFYSKVITLDLATVTPHVSGPNSVKVMRSLPDIQRERVRINKAYLMSCVNARLSDFAAAAKVFRDDKARKVADGVDFYVAAASSEIESEAKARGDWQVLMDAGAIPLPAGCGACIGLGAGTLEPGEVGISATNRNFQGRMGSRDALCYLASPAVVAESAIKGYIAAPQALEVETRAECTVVKAPARPAHTNKIIDGFPAQMTGRVLLLPADNLNTDGIYGKDVTYRDDITFAQQGQYAMANYDPAFQTISRNGDVIVSGRNFGSGSSREQAATALASRGIQCVIAATSSQTYKRNAFNNGFIVLECPDLVDHLMTKLAPNPKEAPRTIPGPTITVDYQRGVITCGGTEFPFPALSPTAQELIAAGGSEAVVQRALAAT